MVCRTPCWFNNNWNPVYSRNSRRIAF